MPILQNEPWVNGPDWISRLLPRDIITCGECGAEHEYGDATYRNSEDGSTYCTERQGCQESCFQQVERRSFRQQVRTRLGAKLAEVEQLLAEIHEEHNGYFYGENEDPAGKLEDLISEVAGQ